MIEWRVAQTEEFTYSSVLTTGGRTAAVVVGNSDDWWATVVRCPDCKGGEAEYMPLRKRFASLAEARQWCERMLNEYGVI